MSYQFSNEEISPKRSIKRRSSPRKVLHISGKSIVAYCRPQTKFGVKVIFLHCLSFCSQGRVPASGGLLLGMGGVCSQGGCLVPGWCLLQGGAWWRPPPDGYCCGRYASYWNAFLFTLLNLDSKPNGYVTLCRSFHTAGSQIQIPILTANCTNGIRIRVRTQVRLHPM